PKTSLYFLITRPKSNKEEWIPIIKKDKIDNIIVSNDYLPSLLGISYWSKSDAEKIKEHIHKFMEKNIL
ncbi:CTP--phosphocholine cytidylyltransferase, partial [Pasteurella multocida]|nr:CTP--phosphocholine cytidylyltransferase [Pasteurella multocida]